MKLVNFFLKYRYLLFRRWLKKTVDYSGKTLVFSDNFKTLDNWNVKDGEFYNDNDVWFSKEALQITNEGLLITCKKDKSWHESWNGNRETTWTSGMIDTRGIFEHSYGTWFFEAQICSSWPAIWLLHRERKEPGYERDQITPEVDIMEVCKGEDVRHTIHFGYSNTVYKTHEIGSDIFKCDNQLHSFAVSMSPRSYKFYIDGILTAWFKSPNKDFTTDTVCYMIINNAASKYNDDDLYNFIIKTVKIFE